MPRFDCATAKNSCCRTSAASASAALSMNVPPPSCDEGGAALRARAAGGVAGGAAAQCATGGPAVEGAACVAPCTTGGTRPVSSGGEGEYKWCAVDGGKWGKCADCPVTCERLAAYLSAQMTAQQAAQQQHSEGMGAASPTKPMLPFVVGDFQCKGWSAVPSARVWVVAWVVVPVSVVSG